MLKIEIIDPHLMTEPQLVNLAKYLMSLAGHELERGPELAPQRKQFFSEPPKKKPEAYAEETLIDNERVESETKTDVIETPEKLTKKRKPRKEKVTAIIIDESGDITEEEPNLVGSETPVNVPPPPSLVPQSSTPVSTPKLDFCGFMGIVADAISTGKITQNRVLEIVKSLGLRSVAAVSERPDLIPAVMVVIDTELAV